MDITVNRKTPAPPPIDSVTITVSGEEFDLLKAALFQASCMWARSTQDYRVKEWAARAAIELTAKEKDA